MFNFSRLNKERGVEEERRKRERDRMAGKLDSSTRFGFHIKTGLKNSPMKTIQYILLKLVLHARLFHWSF